MLLNSVIETFLIFSEQIYEYTVRMNKMGRKGNYRDGIRDENKQNASVITSSAAWILSEDKWT